jgi:hypothetical protein
MNAYRLHTAYRLRESLSSLAMAKFVSRNQLFKDDDDLATEPSIEALPS